MSVEPFPLRPQPGPPPHESGPGGAVRDSLANLASSVGVAACWGPNGPQSALAPSLMRVSVSPPRVLVGLDKQAAGHKALLAAEVIGLSILAAGQRADLQAQSWTGRWSEAADRPPILNDAVAAFVGRVRSRIDAGSHTLLILDLSEAQCRGGAPLVCFDPTHA